jgi:phosphoribosylanthranilate isomerase
MWIKICGNTNVEDTLLAAELGADAVGFVFAPSPRRVTAAQVAEITPKLPEKLAKIGVFTTRDFDEIAATVREAGLTGVQLPGGFEPALVQRLAETFPGLMLIQTAHWMVGQDGAKSAEGLAGELDSLCGAAGLDAVLVDSRTATASGGTGVAFDWQAARRALDELGSLPLVAAGGLNPGNVADAISVLRPWGVDVASGVEAHPGRKDSEKVAEFIRIARASEAQTI